MPDSEVPRGDWKVVCAERVRWLFRQFVAEREILSGGHHSLRAVEAKSIRAMILELESQFAGVPKDRVYIDKRWPKTWWDAFKLRWFPQWLLKRYPAEYQRLHINRTVSYSVCPHLPLDDDSEHLRWLLKASSEPVAVITPDNEPGDAGG